MPLNLWTGWMAFLAGVVAGAVSGLKFHSDSFLGGYSSWRRRLVRLGHISFFGIGLINIVFALTARTLSATTSLTVGSVALVIGAVTMPSICYLAAYKVSFRHLFFIPVLSVLCGVVIMVWEVTHQ